MDPSRLPGAAVTDACHAKLVGQPAGIPFGAGGHRAIGSRRQRPASHPWQRRDSRAKSSTMGAAGGSIIAALLSACIATTTPAAEDRIPNSDAAALSPRSITARRAAGDRDLSKAPEAAPWLRRELPAHLGALVHRVRQETVTPLPEPNLGPRPTSRSNGRRPQGPRRADRSGRGGGHGCRPSPCLIGQVAGQGGLWTSKGRLHDCSRQLQAPHG
jgi:hypothetical protein